MLLVLFLVLLVMLVLLVVLVLVAVLVASITSIYRAASIVATIDGIHEIWESRGNYDYS